VGGGSEDPPVSENLVRAVALARQRGARVVAIVGRDGGYAGAHADACVRVPVVDPQLVTPLTESFQALVWHLLVSHPRLQVHPARWESVAPGPSSPPEASAS
jgi:D-sedoheptulose 7-phosphate isomerase